MKNIGNKIAIGLAVGLAPLVGARALAAHSSGDPYSGIVERNVFALKPVTATPREETPPPAPLKVVLTGIVKAFGKKQVFFKTPMSGKPGEAPKETSFMLSEGERAGEIEVVEINAGAGTVRVRNRGVEQSLSLERDGLKPTGGTVADGAQGTVPGMGVPGGSVAGSSAHALRKTLSPEEQIVVMEINRKLSAEKVARGELPPLPDTPFTPKPQ